MSVSKRRDRTLRKKLDIFSLIWLPVGYEEAFAAASGRGRTGRAR